ncbi:MAG: glycosyltransferase family 4 protein [Fimbriimonadales bacterium]|nr:glycosyltransferase family 4 protein [Fimbriimonadales bacterium]
MTSLQILYGGYGFMPYSLGLINELSERHHVHLAVHAPGAKPLGEGWRELLSPKVHIHYGGGTPSRQKQPLSFYRSEAEFLRKACAQADIVHLQDSNDILLLLTLFRALKKRRGPLILTVHDPEPHSGDAPRLYPFRMPLIRRLREGADAVVVLSEFSLKELLRVHPKIPPERVVVIPHGAMDFFLRWAPEGGSKQRQSVLFFGRMVAYKGLGVLLRAWDEVARHVPEARLIVAGSGPDLANYLQEIEASPSIELLARHLMPHEISHLFARASILVLPYTDATQSGVLSIAYPFGMPVVATSVGGLKDMVKPDVNGVLVPPGDASALASALIKLLTDDEFYVQLSHGAKRTYHERLSWKVLAPQFEDLYLRLRAETRRKL